MDAVDQGPLGGHVAVGHGLGLAAGQHDAVPGVPAPQLRGPEGVVGEQEVVHRVRDAVAAPLEVVGDQRVDPRLVRGLAGAPLRLAPGPRAPGPG